MNREKEFTKEEIGKAQKVPILNVLKMFGKTRPNKKAVCCFNPSHEDKNPSMSITGNLFYCNTPSCGIKGTAIDAYMLLAGCDFVEAVKRLLNYDESASRIIADEKIQDEPEDREPTAKDLEVYAAFFELLDLTDKGREYLHSRGLGNNTIEQWDLRSIDSPKVIEQELRWSFTESELLDSGLFYYGDKVKFLFGRSVIIFPHFEKSVPYYFSGRAINGDKKYNLRGKSKRMFVGDIQDKQTIFIFESVIDALSFFQVNDNPAIVSTGGISGSEKFIKSLSEQFPASKLMLCYDNDEAGRNATDNLYKQFAYLKQQNLLDRIMWDHLFARLDMSPVKDFNDLLRYLQRPTV